MCRPVWRSNYTNIESNIGLISVFLFDDISNEDLLSIFYPEPLDFEAYCHRVFNPFADPDTHNNSYGSDVNFHQLLGCTFESEFYF